MSQLMHPYQQKTADWRSVLRRNRRNSNLVIFAFIAIYLALGLLIDVYWRAATNPGVSYGQILYAISHGLIIPYASILCGIIAIISLLVTFSFHDRLMLLGTEYVEITAQAEDLKAKQLYNIVEEMRLASGLAYTPKLYIIQAEYMNAFASGYSEKSAMIAITQGLLENLDRDELTAVVAHELSHIRHGDIKLTLMASVLSNLLLIIIDVLFYSILFGGQGTRDRDREGGRGINQLAIIIIVLRYLLPIITMLLTLFLSRSREYMADAGCVELMRDNEPLARALLKITNHTEANKDVLRAAYGQTAHEQIRRSAYVYDPAQAGIRAGGAMMDLLSTHPSLKKRLAALGFKAKQKD